MVTINRLDDVIAIIQCLSDSRQSSRRIYLKR